MSPMNLATVFGPNILRMEDETDMMKIVRDSPKVNRIMVYLITHATSVFGVCASAALRRSLWLVMVFGLVDAAISGVLIWDMISLWGQLGQPLIDTLGTASSPAVQPKAFSSSVPSCH